MVHSAEIDPRDEVVTAVVASRRELRETDRHPCSPDAQARILVWPNFTPQTAIVRDVSAAGVGLLFSRPLRPGARLSLQLGGHVMARAVAARVVHCTPQGGEWWLIGCRLARPLTDEELDSLLDAVDDFDHLALGPAAGPEQGGGPERRVSERFLADMPTSCRSLVDSRNDSWPARVKDISTTGIALAVWRRFEPGAVLALDVENPSQGPLTLFARVVHATPQGQGRWLLGCGLIREASSDELASCRAKRVRPVGPDSRAWVRFPCDLPTVYQEEGNGSPQPWPARLVNFSPRGLGLVVLREPSPGALLNLELPGKDGRPPLRLLVRVVQTQAQAEGGWLVGCELAQKLDEEQLEALGW
jgi:hypothetical protein